MEYGTSTRELQKKKKRKKKKRKKKKNALIRGYSSIPPTKLQKLPLQKDQFSKATSSSSNTTTYLYTLINKQNTNNLQYTLFFCVYKIRNFRFPILYPFLCKTCRNSMHPFSFFSLQLSESFPSNYAPPISHLLPLPYSPLPLWTVLFQTLRPGVVHLEIPHVSHLSLSGDPPGVLPPSTPRLLNLPSGPTFEREACISVQNVSQD